MYDKLNFIWIGIMNETGLDEQRNLKASVTQVQN